MRYMILNIILYRYTRDELITMAMSDVDEGWTHERRAEVWKKCSQGDIAHLETVKRRKDNCCKKECLCNTFPVTCNFLKLLFLDCCINLLQN